MTDLNKILDDIQEAADIEKTPRVAFYLNAASTHIDNAIQLKMIERNRINIDELGIGNDRVNHGRRASDKPSAAVISIDAK